MPQQDSRALWWYLLAKCSIRECVSACGNIGEEAGLQEMHTDQQGLGETDLTWLKRARDRLERETETSVPSRTRCQITPRASAPPALPQEPWGAEMLFPSTEPMSHSGPKDRNQGTGNSRLREVSLEHRLDGQIASLWVLAEVLLGPELVLQCRGKVSHVLTGCGLQGHKYDEGAV